MVRKQTSEYQALSGAKLLVDTHKANQFILVPGALRCDPRRVGDSHLKLDIETSLYRDYKPGQFVMLRWPGQTLARPFTILSWKANGPRGILLLQVRLGSPSLDSLVELAKDSPVSVMGPLGREPLLPQAPVFFASWRGGAVPAFALFSPRMKVRAGLGSPPDYWLHGETQQSDVDEELAARAFARPDELYLGKEEGFLNAVLDGVQKAEASVLHLGAHLSGMILPRLPQGRSVLLRMDERMGCGIGLCFSCSVLCKDGPKRSCLFGPYFLSDEIKGRL